MPYRDASQIREASAEEELRSVMRVLNFFFRYNPAGDRYEFRANGIFGGIPVQVDSVVAVHWSQVPGRGANPALGTFAQIRGVELSGNHVMVTTQFTGCSFCMKQVVNTVY